MTTTASWYRTGTATVTQGSAAVSGSGTAWLSQSLPGDLFAITDSNGNLTTSFTEVLSVTSDTALTLKSIWPGSTAIGSKYVLVRNFTGSMPADLAARLSKLIAQYQITVDEMSTLLTSSGMVTLTLLTGETVQVAGLLGVAQNTVAQHEALQDPHPQYATAAEAAAAAPVQSVAGKTGAVTLAKGDVGLGNVDNTSDANKPISTATQAALNAKLNASQATAAGLALLGAADVAAQRSALGLANHEKVTVDASGNLGLGEADPQTKLVVRKDNMGGLGPVLALVNYTSNTLGSSAAINFGLENSTYDGPNCNVQLKAVVTHTSAASDLVISTWDGTAAGERLRLHSSGRLLLGTTTDDGVNLFQCAGNGRFDGTLTVARGDVGHIGTFKAGSDAGYGIRFCNASWGDVGSIILLANSTAFNTSSDRRLKANILPANDSGTLLDSVQIVSHDWKAGGHTRYGVIAQDLHAVFPEAVTVGDDGEAIKQMWAVDYSKLVAPLLLEVQSLRRRVAVLEAV